MVMTAEQHLWACALEVERQHGAAAYLFAAMRADGLEAEGAFEGARTWRAILSRIEALEKRDGAVAQLHSEGAGCEKRWCFVSFCAEAASRSPTAMT